MTEESTKMANEQFEAYFTIKLIADSREKLEALQENLPDGITITRMGDDWNDPLADRDILRFCEHNINIDWSVCDTCGMVQDEF